MEQLEAEKHELETQNQEIRNSGSTGAGAIPGGKGQDRIVQLEQELTQTRDQLVQSQREVQKLQSQIRNKEVSSTGPVLSKSRSLEVRNFPPFHFCVLSSAFLNGREQVPATRWKLTKMWLSSNEIFRIVLKEKLIFVNSWNSQKKKYYILIIYFQISRHDFTRTILGSVIEEET